MSAISLVVLTLSILGAEESTEKPIGIWKLFTNDWNVSGEYPRILSLTWNKELKGTAWLLQWKLSGASDSSPFEAFKGAYEIYKGDEAETLLLRLIFTRCYLGTFADNGLQWTLARDSDAKSRRGGADLELQLEDGSLADDAIVTTVLRLFKADETGQETADYRTEERFLGLVKTRGERIPVRYLPFFDSGEIITMDNSVTIADVLQKSPPPGWKPYTTSKLQVVRVSAPRPPPSKFPIQSSSTAHSQRVEEPRPADLHEQSQQLTMERLSKLEESAVRSLPTDDLMSLADDSLETNDDRTAIYCFEELILRNPKDVPAMRILADIYATAGDADLRNMARAKLLALDACNQTRYRDPVALTSLAAAEANAGNMRSAINFQTMALRCKHTQQQDDVWNRRLNLYRTGRPMRYPSAGK